MTTSYVLLAILAMTAVTFALRAVPFVLPKKSIQHPIIRQIAGFMPLVIMTTLVIHAFKGVSWTLDATTTATLAGVLVVAATQYKFRIPLLSIFLGVAVHILILNFA